MSVGGKKGGPQSDINVTPMIDVVMVLLIIFMVVQQGLQKGLDVQVPPVENADEVAQAIDQIVLSINPGGRYDVNSEVIPAANLQARLKEIYNGRNRRVIFVRGAENITYGDIIFGIDAARAAGIDVVGLVPRT
jgi:biopolymer transport protein ExbD/biopolymer transport protein TolR